MLPDAPCSNPLQRVSSIAAELAGKHPNALDLLKELYDLAVYLARQEQTPQPIETAPQEAGLQLLLYCPRQDGWHTGEWYQGAWTDALTRVKNLDPTHWLDLPRSP